MTASPWQPTTFLRFERALASSTFPAQIVTDTGRAYIKVINNPIGSHALVRDWVGTSLARWFGLPTFDFAILELDEMDEIILHDDRRAQPGPAFVTRAVEGHPWGGSTNELKLLDNPEAISRLVVFDTWTRNPDRHPPDLASRQPHRDNVFLSGEGATPGRFRLIAMDHTECFLPSSRDLTSHIATIENIQDERIYGLFPEFVSLIQVAELQASAERLHELDEATVGNILASIPSAWDMAESARTALRELILQRAKYVANTIVDRVRALC